MYISLNSLSGDLLGGAKEWSYIDIIAYEEKGEKSINTGRESVSIQ